jgi:hypothetical protein
MFVPAISKNILEGAGFLERGLMQRAHESLPCGSVLEELLQYLAYLATYPRDASRDSYNHFHLCSLLLLSALNQKLVFVEKFIQAFQCQM